MIVVLDYRRGGHSPTACFVCKGVTSDRGPELKTAASMEDMKSDMTGAAVVVAIKAASAPEIAGQCRRIPRPSPRT